jgi:two-component system sensor histidine kinase/response regulator
MSLIRNEKILVVDDDENILTLLYTFLTKEGFKVIKSSESKNVFPLALKYKPDLIILDVVMPEHCGCDVAVALKEHKDLCQIPVIFFSGMITEVEAKMYNQSGKPHKFLAKGSPLKELLTIIYEKLNAK